MNASELLGAVGAASLRERLANASENDGLARFMLDRAVAQMHSDRHFVPELGAERRDLRIMHDLDLLRESSSIIKG